jgi:uncharacterized protein YecT (DUF1311 family)
LCIRFERLGDFMKLILIVSAMLFAISANAGTQKPDDYNADDCDSPVTSELIACTGEAFDKAEKVLNTLYPKVMTALPSDVARQSLRKSERAWLKGRDKGCTEENPDDPDAAEYPVEQNACLEKKDAARIKFLANMKECQASAACKPH